MNKQKSTIRKQKNDKRKKRRNQTNKTKTKQQKKHARTLDLVHNVLSGSLPLLSLDEDLVHFLGLGLVVLAHVLLESHNFQRIGAAAVLVVCQVKVGQLSFVLPYFLDQSFVSTLVLRESAISQNSTK